MELLIVLLALMLLFNYLLLQGVNKHEEALIVPYLFMMACAVGMITYLNLEFRNFAHWFLLLFSIYCLICLYSLYDKFKSEKLDESRDRNLQMQSLQGS